MFCQYARVSARFFVALFCVALVVVSALTTFDALPGSVAPLALAGSVQEPSAITPSLRLVPPDSAPAHSDVVAVQVVVENGVNLGAFEFEVSYDPTLVGVGEVMVAPFLAGAAGCNPRIGRCGYALGPVEQGNTAAVGAYTIGQGPGASGTGMVATLHLKPTGATGTVTLHIINPLLVDVAANLTVPLTQDVSFTLTPDSTPEPMPESTSEPSPAPMPTLIPGLAPELTPELAPANSLYLPALSK
jgi:hypothetical protein